MFARTGVAGITVFALVVALAVAYVSHQRDVPMSRGLTVTSLGVAGSLLSELGVQTVGETAAVQAFGTTVAILIIGGWVYLIAHYTGNEWAVEGYRVYVVVLPLSAVALAYWVDVLAVASGIQVAVPPVGSFATWQAVYDLYSYLLAFVTIGALVLRFVHERPIYRRRAALLAVAPLSPALLAAAYMLESVPLDVNLTPVGYAMTTTMALFALQRYDLLEIVPLAREATVNNIDDAVIAVTNDGVVASVNDPGTEMLAVTDDVVGDHISVGLSEHPAVVDPVERGAEERLQVGDRHLQVSLTPIETKGVRLGTVVQLKDVTREVERTQELEAQQRRLERRNEQLDEFASVVSHDIRNPLAAAKGHLELVAEQVDDEASVEYVAEAHERIETIVEDLLTLARQGQQVAEPVEVDLRQVSDEVLAVTAVDPDRFEFRGPQRIRADPSRLRQLLENLFRNSVDHGGPDVTVEVGPLDGVAGFYVADDGPGVPADERESVFEYGYTSSEDGTGLGLSIVQTVAEAHDWDVGVTEAAKGGARFEIRTDRVKSGERSTAEV